MFSIKKKRRILSIWVRGVNRVPPPLVVSMSKFYESHPVDPFVSILHASAVIFTGLRFCSYWDHAMQVTATNLDRSAFRRTKDGGGGHMIHHFGILVIDDNHELTSELLRHMPRLLESKSFQGDPRKNRKNTWYAPSTRPPKKGNSPQRVSLSGTIFDVTDSTNVRKFRFRAFFEASKMISYGENCVSGIFTQATKGNTHHVKMAVHIINNPTSFEMEELMMQCVLVGMLTILSSIQPSPCIVFFLSCTAILGRVYVAKKGKVAETPSSGD